MKLGTTDSRSRVNTERTDRAVSPVIGAILMVAITVILAAVIGLLVFGLRDELGDAGPANTMDVGFDISVVSGDNVDLHETTLVIDGPSIEVESSLDEEISAGESHYVEMGSSDIFEGSTTELRHDPSDSIILSEEAPDYES